MEQTDTAPKTRLRPWRWGIFLTLGVILVAWLINTPPGLFGKADAVGYAICHRLSERSFHIGTRQLPLCVRCSGMYLGAMWGLVFQAWRSPRRARLPGLWVWIGMGIASLAFMIDGVNSYLHLIPELGLSGLYEPRHSLRLITGEGMGLVIALLLYPIFNQTIWARYEYTPAIKTWRDGLGLLAGSAILAGLVFIEKPITLYPLALVSSLGVVIVLTLLYTTLGIVTFRRENRAEHWKHLMIPVCLGLIACLAQISLIDWVRFTLTHTWGGIPLP